MLAPVSSYHGLVNFNLCETNLVHIKSYSRIDSYYTIVVFLQQCLLNSQTAHLLGCVAIGKGYLGRGSSVHVNHIF